MTPSFDPISLGILWDRLISITDEIVETLVRTSFSTKRSRRCPTPCPCRFGSTAIQ